MGGKAGRKPRNPKTAIPTTTSLERNAALERLIFEDPARERFAIYADWLQEHGNPLGTVIASQLAAEHEPKSKRKLKMAATALLERYIADHLVPSYRPIQHRFTTFKLRDSQQGADKIGNSQTASIGWRLGFIRSIGTWLWTAEMVRDGMRLLADPHSVLLEALDLRSATVDSLAPFAHLRNLRELELRWSNTGSLADLAPVAQLPRLERFGVRGSAIRDLAPIARLPIERLTIRDAPLADLSPLAAHPRLHAISFENTQVRDVSPLFDCPNLCEVWLGDTVPRDQARELQARIWANGAKPGSGIEPSKIVYGAR